LIILNLIIILFFESCYLQFSAKKLVLECLLSSMAENNLSDTKISCLGYII